jgi:hypothetical protein
MGHKRRYRSTASLDLDFPQTGGTSRLERVKKFAFGVDRETAALVWQARSIG